MLLAYWRVVSVKDANNAFLKFLLLSPILILRFFFLHIALATQFSLTHSLLLFDLRSSSVLLGENRSLHTSSCSCQLTRNI